MEGTYSSLPFGDGYSATGEDSDAYHFAGQDQNSSAIDHAQYREYSNMSGRWFSPDPYTGSYDLTNPQTMNRYAYVLANPLMLVDPSGLDPNPCDDSTTSVNDIANGVQVNADPCDDGVGGGGGGSDPSPSSGPSYGQIGNGPPGGGGGGGGGGLGNAPNNGFGKTPVHGLWTYGNWCGAGGSGTPINSTDAACMAHDQCYDNLNLTADQYMSGNLSPAQIQGAAACNQQLCNAALNANRNPSTPFSQRWAGAEIILFFSLTGPKGAQCQGF